MYNMLTIIGARPQIIKSAAISRNIKSSFSNVFKEHVLHTGQHYDSNMSGVFFSELGIDEPEYNLNVGSGSHSEQTGNMMIGIENIMTQNSFDAVIIYGDTNSTVAAALVASKLNIPVVHIESGLRSGDKRMPEELNRKISDHLSSLLFTPTATGYQNLMDEGFRSELQQPNFKNHKPRRVIKCGDVMYDNTLYYSELAETKMSEWFDALSLKANQYVLATVHRAENTDSAHRLTDIFDGLLKLNKIIPVVLPLHPRTKKALDDFAVDEFKTRIYNELHIIPPCSYLQITLLEKFSKMIVTDSGGVQKEAYYFKKPSIVLRDETEWVENVEAGVSVLVGCDANKLISAYEMFCESEILKFSEIYGDGSAAVSMLEEIKKYLDK